MTSDALQNKAGPASVSFTQSIPTFSFNFAFDFFSWHLIIYSITRFLQCYIKKKHVQIFLKSLHFLSSSLFFLSVNCDTSNILECCFGWKGVNIFKWIRKVVHRAFIIWNTSSYSLSLVPSLVETPTEVFILMALKPMLRKYTSNSLLNKNLHHISVLSVQ